MSTHPYAPPLDRLLTLGDAWKMEPWPDYLALGLGPEHIPDLIQMATDSALNEADSDSKEVWAPGHAWRALAQLHAVEAAAPLTQLFRRIDEGQDDFVGEDLPVAFGVLGPGAIPALTAYLADNANGLWARVAARHSLQQIGAHHPEARDECVGILARQLEHFAEQEAELNGFLIGYLLDLKGAEAASVMERALASGRVDESIAGDWEDVQIELGLKAGRDRPRRLSALQRQVGETLDLLTHDLVRDRTQPRSKAEIEARAEQAVLAARLKAAAGSKRKRHRKRK